MDMTVDKIEIKTEKGHEKLSPYEIYQRIVNSCKNKYFESNDKSFSNLKGSSQAQLNAKKIKDAKKQKVIDFNLIHHFNAVINDIKKAN